MRNRLPGKLNNAIGRDVVFGGVDRVDKAVARRSRSRAGSHGCGGGHGGGIRGLSPIELKEYREREARWRRQPPYMILKDETINLIAEHQPTDLGRLSAALRGLGRQRWSCMGQAIIGIVRGE